MTGAESIQVFRPSYHVFSIFPCAVSGIVNVRGRDSSCALGADSVLDADTLEDAIAIRNAPDKRPVGNDLPKPSFREPIRRKRCLVPASGFFDWRHEGEHKVPYYTSMIDRIIAFAGLFDCWHNKELDEYVGTYSIITTGANEMMRYIHNTNFRMLMGF